ncbi:MAG: hypothetical protein JO161_02940 [Planctomycetaceae bacterium]|nr:hypothetical protein [Planctomycetaceae bacterium]
MTDLPNDASKATDHPGDPGPHTDHHCDLDLHADRLEALMESPPPGQPVVVIQYRDRGVPWYAVVLIALLIPLVAAAVYYRATSRPGVVAVPVQTSVVAAQTPPSTLQPVPPIPPVPPAATSPQPESASGNKAATATAATAAPTSGTASAQPPVSVPSPVPSPSDVPLALNSQPLAPAAIEQVARSAEALAKQIPPQADMPQLPAETTKKGPDDTQATPRVALSPPLAIGFSTPADPESPFAELDISRGGTAATATVGAVGDQAALEGSPATANATPADSQPGPREQPTQEQLLHDIQAEAAAKGAEMRQLRDVKDRVQGQIEAENQARVEADRIEFRRELDEILSLGGKEVGKNVDDLCERHGRNYDEELQRKIRRNLKFGGRRGLEDKVQMMRLRGVPEAGILDFLANELNHSLHARNGPQSEDEVRVTAARLLLRMKVGKESGSAPREPQVSRSRSTAAAIRGNPPGNLELPR